MKKMFSTTCPHLLHEWDYEKNTINPENITYGSKKKVFWICSINPEHRWETMLFSRTSKKKPTGCPFCTNQKSDKKNNFSLFHPHLLAEWDYEKNKIKPDEILSKSNKRIFWICSKNKEHKWSAILSSRVGGNGCPYCAGKKTDHTTCLSTTHPYLLEEWDYEKNDKLGIFPDNISKGSNKKTFWICKEKHHKYFCSISNRTKVRKPRGCPFCSGQKPSLERSIFHVFPDLLEEWNWDKNNKNNIFPHNVTFGSGKKIWWVCKKNKNHIWEATMCNRTNKKVTRGCPICPTKISSGHKEVILFLEEWYFGKILINDRNTIKNPITKMSLELDIFLPEIKFAIEYNGDYYHSKNNVKIKDEIKSNECRRQQIELYVIKEEQWKNNKNIIKDEIISFLSKRERLTTKEAVVY